MGVVQLILLILSLLRNLQNSKTEEEFMSTSSTAIGDGTLLKWLWDNKEEVIKFIITLIGMIGGGGTQPTPDVSVQLKEIANL